MFQRTSVAVLSQVLVTFFSSIVVLTANGNIWVVPLLHPVSEMSLSCKRVAESYIHLRHKHCRHGHTDTPRRELCQIS